jgi:hypothetical protein
MAGRGNVEDLLFIQKILNGRWVEMVDSAINLLFVDLNSYVASIGQELCSELRGESLR